LRGTEDDRLLALIDHPNQQPLAIRFTIFDLDNLVEVLFFAALAQLDVAFDDVVVGGVDIVIA
jgi:hypothetical protein